MIQKFSKLIALGSFFYGASVFAVPLYLAPSLTSGSGQSAMTGIDCTLDGQRQTCLLDTGGETSHYLLPDSAQIAAQHPVTGQLTIAGVQGQLVTQDLTVVEHFQIGDWIAAGLSVIRLDSQKAAEGRFMPTSVVASDVLAAISRSSSESGLTLQLDYEQLDLSFDAQSVAFPDEKLMPLEFFKSPQEHSLGVIPVLPVTVGDQAQTALWDTGVTLTLVDQGYIQALPDLFEEVQVEGEAAGSRASDVSGQTVVRPIWKMKALKIADYTLADLLVQSADLTSLRAKSERANLGLILGFNALSRFRWRLNYPQSSWSVTAVKDSSKIVEAFQRASRREQ